MTITALWRIPAFKTRKVGALSARPVQILRRAIPIIDRASLRFDADIPLIEAVLARLDPTLSLHQIRARVVGIHDETPDVKTFYLKPNARFGSYRPGAYVNVRLAVDGQTNQRSYSLSSAPRADGLIAITVKRVRGGRVSNWLADTLRPGDVLELSAPQGQFLLPDPPPARLLMLSAGSGITPVMSMLRQLVATEQPSEVVFLHFARTPEDIVFKQELEHIAQQHPRLRIGLCVEAADRRWTGPRGRFSATLLQHSAPDFRSLDTYLCGPAGFMQSVIQTLEQADADLSKLRYERFNVAFDAAQFLAHAQVLRFVRSGTESISSRPRTILEEAESLGVPIASGCRAGNCGTCRCRKTRGVVVDITTGRESTPDAEFIFPCVSVARGTVEIDL
jgi:ferredoxin-NADP reductase